MGFRRSSVRIAPPRPLFNTFGPLERLWGRSMPGRQSIRQLILCDLRVPGCIRPSCSAWPRWSCWVCPAVRSARMTHLREWRGLPRPPLVARRSGSDQSWPGQHHEDDAGQSEERRKGIIEPIQKPPRQAVARIAAERPTAGRSTSNQPARDLHEREDERTGPQTRGRVRASRVAVAAATAADEALAALHGPGMPTPRSPGQSTMSAAASASNCRASAALIACATQECVSLNASASRSHAFSAANRSGSQRAARGLGVRLGARRP